MRILILVLALACLFGGAALWHQHRVATARDAQSEARRIAAGEAARTEVGVLREGWSAIVVGKPAERVASASTANAASAAPPGTAPPPSSDPAIGPTAAPTSAEAADFELVVQPGQSLSKIAAAQYGTSRKELVDALARYNGLASPDALQAGFKLKLPSPAILQAFANSR